MNSALLFISCITLGRLINFSEPQFPSLDNDENGGILFDYQKKKKFLENTLLVDTEFWI